MRPLILVAVLGLAGSVRAQEAAPTDCTYQTCALRFEPGLFGPRLVRGVEGVPVGRPGLFGPDLTRAVGTSPEALSYARAYERARTPAIVTATAAGLLFGGMLTGRFSDEVQAGAAVGGLTLLVVRYPFSIRAQRALSRAVWTYNGSLDR